MGAIFITLIVTAVLLFWPFKVIDVVQPMPTAKQEYRAGETVVFEIDYCKYRGTATSASKVLVNDTIYSYSTTGVSLAKGCNTFLSESTVIPQSAHPGKYHIEITVTYRVNPFQVQTHTFKTTEFDIIE